MLSSDDDKCQASSKKDMVNVTLTSRAVVQLRLAKPCLQVCNRVVQQCPYYLPSKFQKQNQNISEETIYGGYPVFDCPGIIVCMCVSRYNSMYVCVQV